MMFKRIMGTLVAGMIAAALTVPTASAYELVMTSFDYRTDPTLQMVFRLPMVIMII